MFSPDTIAANVKLQQIERTVLKICLYYAKFASTSADTRYLIRGTYGLCGSAVNYSSNI